MEYSAVTHPVPLPRRNGGTLSSTEAVQITFVSPNSTRTEPSACLVNFLVTATLLSSPAPLPLFLIVLSVILNFLSAPAQYPPDPIPSGIAPPEALAA